MKIKVSNVNTPNWKDVNVKSHIPVELEKLSELARNIWWSWNYEATELFRDLDPALWKEVGQNPVLLLERMSYAKLEALANDKVILRRLDAVEVFYSFDDKEYTMMRNAWLQDNCPVMVGLMGASPDGDGFTARFEDFTIRHLPDLRRTQWLENNK